MNYTNLIDIIRSQTILANNFVCGKIEDIQRVWTRLNSRIANSNCTSVKYPKSITLVCMNSKCNKYYINYLMNKFFIAIDYQFVYLISDDLFIYICFFFFFNYL